MRRLSAWRSRVSRMRPWAAEIAASVLDVVAVGAVEAAQAQVARQRAQMAVEHEAQGAQWLGTERQLRADVEGLEDGIDRHAVAVADDVVEVHGDAVGDDQLHLGVGHAERLDHVLDRCTSVECVHERRLASLGREEVVQLLVEAEAGTGHRGGPIRGITADRCTRRRTRPAPRPRTGAGRGGPSSRSRRARPHRRAGRRRRPRRG